MVICFEGSSDALVATEDFVHVVSSVYDIEHYDFLESAVWTFSHSGEEIHVHRVDERPWSIISTEDEILLGMGRPKCGIAKLNQLHEIEIIHDTDSPITCGLERKYPMFVWNANGEVINQYGKTLMSSKGDSVEAVILFLKVLFPHMNQVKYRLLQVQVNTCGRKNCKKSQLSVMVLMEIKIMSLSVQVAE